MLSKEEWCMIEMNGGVSKGESLGHSLGDESLTLRRCYICGLSLLYEALGDVDLSVAKPVKRVCKGKFSFSFIL